MEWWGQEGKWMESEGTGSFIQQMLIKCLLYLRLSWLCPAVNKDSYIHGACVPALFTEYPSKNILEGSGRTRDWTVFLSRKVKWRELFPTGWWGWSLWLSRDREERLEKMREGWRERDTQRQTPITQSPPRPWSGRLPLEAWTVIFTSRTGNDSTVHIWWSSFSL